MRTLPGVIGEKFCFSRASVLYIFRTLMDDYLCSAGRLLHRGDRPKTRSVTGPDASMTNSPKTYTYFDKMLI
jgi:hypothetical protein